MSEIAVEQIDQYRFRVARDPSSGMRTDLRVYASAVLMEQIQKDRSLEQAKNVATLPGIVGSSLAMPDIHKVTDFRLAAWQRRTLTMVLSRRAEWGSTSTAAFDFSGATYRRAMSSQESNN